MGYPDTPELTEKLVPLAKSMKKEFEVALERVRVVDLRQATNAMAYQILDDGNDYDQTLAE